MLGRGRSYSLPPLIPWFNELLHGHGCGWMSCVVIVRKSKDFSDSLILDKTPQHNDPIPQITLPVNDRLAPSLSHFLNSFSIALPRYIGKIRRNEINCAFYLPRPRHTVHVGTRSNISGKLTYRDLFRAWRLGISTGTSGSVSIAIP